MLKQGGAEPGERLEFAEADLTSDTGWAGSRQRLRLRAARRVAVSGQEPKDEDELIVPAREGALRVLRAARDAGVKRVVLTSSFAAIGYGQQPHSAPFNEDQLDRSRRRRCVGLHEIQDAGRTRRVGFHRARRRRARALRRQSGGRVWAGARRRIFPPRSFWSSGHAGWRGCPALPRLSFGVVDVRDVADLHMRAMTDPAAKGERFLAVAGDFMSMQQIAQALKDGMGAAAGKVSTRQLPDWLVRFAAFSARRRGRQPRRNSEGSRTARTRRRAACSAGRRAPVKRRLSRRARAW